MKQIEEKKKEGVADHFLKPRFCMCSCSKGKPYNGIKRKKGLKEKYMET